MRKFKVGDRVIKNRGYRGENPSQKVIGTVTGYSDRGSLRVKLDDLVAGMGSTSQDTEDRYDLLYPDTQEGRRQEQLDLIAKKEAVLAEAQKAIEDAKQLIAEIDNRPPIVGDVYRFKHSNSGNNFKIVNIFVYNGIEYTNYIFSVDNAVKICPKNYWTNGYYTRVV